MWFCRIFYSERVNNMSLPKFYHLVIFPEHLAMRGRAPNAAQGGRRNCCMCGQLCIYGVHRVETGQNTISKSNKGVCTACTTTVFTLPESNIAFKWCAHEKHFCPIAAFGDGPMDHNCFGCWVKIIEMRRRRRLHLAAATH